MKSKWLLALVIGSLTLNLALVGYLVGSRGGHFPGMDVIKSFPRWARELPDERRASLRPLVRQHIDSVRPLLRDMRKQYQSLHDVLSEEVLDNQALAASLRSIREHQNRLQEVSHASFINFVQALTIEERQQMVDKIPTKPPRHHGGHRPDRRELPPR